MRASATAPPSQEPLAKSASLPELAAPAQPAQLPADTTQVSQPDQAPKPEPEPRIRLSLSADDLHSQSSAKQAQSNQIIQELVEVLDLSQDKPSRQDTAKKPEQEPAEQKPEQANKWLAFQKLVSQQAAEEAASQKVSVPGTRIFTIYWWVEIIIALMHLILISCCTYRVPTQSPGKIPSLRKMAICEISFSRAEDCSCCKEGSATRPGARRAQVSPSAGSQPAQVELRAGPAHAGHVPDPNAAAVQ